MTVNELYEQCKKLIEDGYGEAHVIKLEDFEDYRPATWGVYPATDFTEDTFFGKPFPNKSKQFVYIDMDTRVSNKFEGYNEPNEEE